MASEVAPLPLNVLNNVVSFTGNVTLNSNVIQNVSSLNGIVVDMIINGPGLSNNSTVINTYSLSGVNYVEIDFFAIKTVTGATLNAGVTSYTTEFIYNAVPQVVQDQDASNGYTLYSYIYNSAQMLDSQVNLLSRGGIGPEGIFDPNYIEADGWSQILDVDRCPEFALPWLAQFVGVTIETNSSLTRTQKVDQIKNRSTFVRGSVVALVNVIESEINSSSTAPYPAISSNQIIVLEQTKPYTVSFLGNTHSTTTIDGITSTAGLSSGMYVYGTNIPIGTYISSVSTNSIVLNQAVTASTNGLNITASSKTKYTPDQYSMVILIPTVYFNNYTYANLNAKLTNVSYVTPFQPALPYSTIDTDINALGSNGYSNLLTSSSPQSQNVFQPYIYKYRPAGVQIYIGGY